MPGLDYTIIASGLKIMNFGSGKRIAAAGTYLLVAAVLGAQQAQAPVEKPLMAEQVFKNIKVLKGIPVGEFMDTMGFFASSLGLNCVYCHVEASMEDWSKFAEDVPRKQTARAMILMVNSLNKGTFGGKRALTCYTCHRGAPGSPKTLPSLAEQYGLPIEDPDEVEIVKDAPPGPSADQILDTYIQAVGGAQRLAALTSYTAKGNFSGYDTYHIAVPLELYAQAPGQRTLIAHTQNGDDTTTFNGREGWVADAGKPMACFRSFRDRNLMTPDWMRICVSRAASSRRFLSGRRVSRSPPSRTRRPTYSGESPRG